MGKRKIEDALTIYSNIESEPENKKPREEANINISQETSPSTGMTNAHTLELTKFSSSNDMVLIWRPINEHAATKLDDTHRLYKGKGLNVKGKSSEFGPIAGEVPLNVALSKVATTQPEKIPDYQAINDACLKKEQSEYDKLKSTTNSDNINEINEKQFLTSSLKKDDQNRPIYYFTRAKEDSSQEEVIWDVMGLSPVLAAKGEDGNFYDYDPDTKAFQTKPYILEENSIPHEVKILAYREFVIKEDGQLETRERLITADYDELVSASRKIFPFDNNIEITTTLNINSLFLALSLPNVSEETRIKVVSDFILKYEEKLKNEERKLKVLKQQEHMGFMNTMQRAAKTYLKFHTDGATNHGPEVNNPFPEELKPGNYTVYLPEGHVEILKNEEEICNFINIKRKEGFPLAVNPKWGWELNENRELYIPTHKFDWEKVHKGLNDYQENIRSLELYLAELEKKEDVNKKPTERENEAKYHQIKSNLDEETVKLIKEKDIINKKVKIEKLTLEADIIYSKKFPSLLARYHDQKHGELKGPEKEQVEEFKMKVAKQVAQQEIRNRAEKINQLTNELDKMMVDYRKDYEKPSLIEKALRGLNKLKSDTEIIQLSTTKTNSREK